MAVYTKSCITTEIMTNEGGSYCKLEGGDTYKNLRFFYCKNLIHNRDHGSPGPLFSAAYDHDCSNTTYVTI